MSGGMAVTGRRSAALTPALTAMGSQTLLRYARPASRDAGKACLTGRALARHADGSKPDAA
jgi:hypothetical protein